MAAAPVPPGPGIAAAAGEASGVSAASAGLWSASEPEATAAMAAPAQPKKIVAPTVSQINAEFVTQVSPGVRACVRREEGMPGP